VKRFFGTIWIERAFSSLATLGAACEKFSPGCYEHFSSYGTETLQSHFCLPNTIGWQPAIQSLGTDETLGIHYPQELNVVHIPDRKGT
jgi:hypothetical protein